MSSQPELSIPDWIAASASRALRGNAPNPLRVFSFAFDKPSKKIKFKAEVDRELTDEEREKLAVAETEIYSDCIFGDDTLIETEIKTVAPDQATNPLPGGVAFRRAIAELGDG